MSGSISSLKNTFEFNIVFKSNTRFHKDFLTIHAISLSDFKHKLREKKKYIREIDSKLLLGFSINKKVAKATKRNLIKRRLKAIARILDIHNMAVVFVCRKGILDFDYKDLENHVKYAMKKMFMRKKMQKGNEKKLSTDK